MVAKKKGIRKTGKCIYCGRISPITDDHVPPKNLFPRPRPSNLITVPSCSKCHSENKQVSKDDEYFRLVLALRYDVANHPDINEILPTIMRSLERPEAIGFRNSFLKNLQRVDLVSQGGIYIGNADGYEVNLARIKRVLTRTIKGLFYYEKGYRLPDIYEVSIVLDEDAKELDENGKKDLYTKIMQPLASGTIHTLGNNTFSYVAKFTDIDPNISAWMLIFYQMVYFLCFTIPKQQIHK